MTKGSPPHLRGKLSADRNEVNAGRITPAPAGKTFIYTTTSLSTKDHPRTCGENQYTYRYQTSPLGSPPHLRGKHTHLASFERNYRITPAPAGKTKNFAKTPLALEDHPRTCGENLHRSPLQTAN